MVVRGPAGAAPAHFVHGDDPEPVPHVRSQREQHRGPLPADHSQRRPPARCLLVSFELHDILWGEKPGASRECSRHRGRGHSAHHFRGHFRKKGHPLWSQAVPTGDVAVVVVPGVPRQPHTPVLSLRQAQVFGWIRDIWWQTKGEKRRWQLRGHPSLRPSASLLLPGPRPLRSGSQIAHHSGRQAARGPTDGPRTSPTGGLGQLPACTVSVRPHSNQGYHLKTK